MGHGEGLVPPAFPHDSGAQRATVSLPGGVQLARFQGNTHAASDRAAATLLFIILLVILLLLFWWVADPVGFNAFWTNLDRALPNRP